LIQTEISRFSENDASLVEVRDASNAVGFDSTLVLSTENLEVAVVSPVGSPAVSDEPVWGVVLFSPSNNSDAVTSESTSRSVDINTGLVVDEIFVYGEASFNGSIGGDFGLHQSTSLISRDRVDLAGFVCLPCSFTSAFASDATRSRLEVQAWLLSGWAGGNGVGLARVGW